jgi:hypothetical protein
LSGRLAYNEEDGYEDNVQMQHRAFHVKQYLGLAPTNFTPPGVLDNELIYSTNFLSKLTLSGVLSWKSEGKNIRISRAASCV